MMGNGWISLNRGIQGCYLWKEKPFSRGQAWVDLILMANHKDAKVILGNELLEVERGSFITSEVKLMDKWGWGKGKLRAFLKILEEDNMIVKKSDRKKTTITIVKYSVYQDSKTTDGPITDHKRTDNELITDTNNNDNNDNNDNKINNIGTGSGKKKSDNQSIDYQQIADMYNEICISFPRMKSLSDARKKAIKARLNTYSLADIKTVFEKAEQSDFMKGKNDRNWSATFDWMLKDTNMAKILDGNYDNKGAKKVEQTRPITGPDAELTREQEDELLRQYGIDPSSI